MPVLLPLIAALIYAVSAMAIQRAMRAGAGFFRSTFVFCLAMGILLAPFAFLGGAPKEEARFYQVALTSFLFFLGTVVNGLALDRGDVSVATPILGVKSTMVALLSAVALRQSLPWQWWVGAVLTTLAVALLQWSPRAHHRRVLLTVSLALGSAFIFSITDLMVQTWLPHWGFGKFVGYTFGGQAILAWTLVPFFRKPLSATPRASWIYLIPGALLMGFQAMLMAAAIGLHGNATAANILYSSRGLWSVALVWFAGGVFMNSERGVGGRTMAIRAIGCTLLLVAIALVIAAPPR